MVCIAVTQKKWFAAAVGLLLIVAGGEGLKHVEWTQPTGQSINTVIIQGNVPQQIKWAPEQLMNTLVLYDKLTEPHWSADLVVWPENAIPAFYHQIKPFYLDPLRQKAAKSDTDILLGLPIADADRLRYYNSMLLLGKDEANYQKRHLVPFGEYVPFDWLRGLIAFFNLPMSAFVPGEAEQPLMHVAGQPVGMSICYEDVFTQEILTALPEATVLVNASNNAWYGDSFAPHQHLQISRSRALEVGRPLIRSTTNGISAYVDHHGDIIQQSPQFEQFALSQAIQPRAGSTPYVQGGLWPIYLLALLLMLLWAYYRRKTQD
jgi:apolipoprotein N-acyltransferase